MPARFRKQLIAATQFEAVAVCDVDGDGVLDLVCGDLWYQGPDFRKWHPVSPAARQGEYFDDFSGIVLLNGKLRCGTTQGNIIGSLSQNASILARASLYERPYITGIFAGSADGIDIFDTVLIKNNIISGIKAIPNPGSEAPPNISTGTSSRRPIQMARPS